MNLLDVNDRPGTYPPSLYAAQATPLPAQPAALGDLACDVCVIGGGFTGLSTALHLSERGYSVRLLEAQRIGFGASGRNGGQVCQGQRRDQWELEQMFGQDRARALWTIGREAVALVRNLAEREEVQARFHPGLLHADHRPSYVPHSQAYAAHLQETYGYDAITFLPREALAEHLSTPAYHGGTLDLEAGHINPLELALGLARLAQNAGAHLHEHSRVVKITPGRRPVVSTREATITADHVVLACNGYLGGLNTEVAAHVMPINNYIIATEPLSPDLRDQVMRGNLAVADSKFVVNYFRFSEDNRLLFGGTESYGYRFPKDIAGNVRRAMGRIFPQLADVPIAHAWGGTLGITMNRLPHFACLDGTIVTMSGFSGQGVALGTLSGQMAAEMIAGQAERFDIMAQIPTPRFPGGRSLQYPALVCAMLWYGLRDRLGGMFERG